MTVLLLGSDVRLGADVGDGVEGQRADTIMLVRFDTDGRVTMLSIPRDSWVPIPGMGTQKINAALNGGPALAVRTVANLTGMDIQHVALIDFRGVRELTTALGGIVVNNPTASTDPQTHRHFDAGPINLSGDYALTYVRQRYGLPNGDFDRIARQHAVLAALGRQLAGAHLLGDPVRLHQVVDIAAHATTVDDGLTTAVMSSLLDVVVSAPAGTVRLYTAPVAGYGTSPDGESYVRLDMTKFLAACEALRDGRDLPLTPTPGSAG